MDWDAHYSASDQVWSGRPNVALVAEVSDLPPGRALDVGCGEGADAVWLARRGWRVTGLDPSRVALDRAAAAATDAAVDVRWVHGGLVGAPLADGPFDLVTAHYFVLMRTPEAAAERALLAAVAPGGTLLLVHHADVDPDEVRAHGMEPDDFVSLADVAALLDDAWQVEVDERRPRDAPPGPGAHHHHDLVLRARRSATTG